MDRFQQIISKSSIMLDRMDLNDWMILACIVFVMSFFCLRGFGSRHDY
ncbi:MAG: hypothetical protein P8N76_11095 [Pirellulaceae bacterium]|nr:hypothetical protein [Pirellulaceae bacterium]